MLPVRCLCDATLRTKRHGSQAWAPRGDLPRIHGTDERIAVTSMQSIADFYHVLMSTMDGQKAP